MIYKLWTQIEKRGLPEGFLDFWGTLELIRPFYDQSMLEFVTDSNQIEVVWVRLRFQIYWFFSPDFETKEAEHEHKEYVEIVNGSSVMIYSRYP